MNDIYDLIIIGAGPAGLTASIYASRYKLNHLVIGETPGGQGTLAGIVENYPGFPSIPGPELVQKFLEHAKSYGVEIKQETVKGLVMEKGTEGVTFAAQTESGEYQAKSLILATGASYKNLGIPGEKDFIGKGVSFCTNCDAPFFKGKTVAVIGGGNSAVSGALHVAEFAEKVYLIHRRDEFRAEPYRVEKMKQNPKIELIVSTCVTQIVGTQMTQNQPSAEPGATDRVGGIKLDKPYQGKDILLVDGVFIEIGQVPSSVLATMLGVWLDQKNYVRVNSAMETNVPGVFAAGDLAAAEGDLLLRQFVTSVSDGARAAASAYEFLKKVTPTPSWS